MDDFFALTICLLRFQGIDEPLALYFAHILTYDPLYIPRSQIESNIERNSNDEAEVRKII